jgi:hypothetical protein
MKQAHKLISRGIAACNVRAFVPVTMQARERQILGLGLTAVLARNYVVNV